MSHSTTMTVLVPKAQKDSFRNAVAKYNTAWQAVAPEGVPPVVQEHTPQGEEVLYLEDGLRWWMMEALSLSLTLTLPKIGAYLPLAYEKLEGKVITTHFFGGEKEECEATLVCDACGRRVAQGYRLLQEEEGRILFLSGRCLETVGLERLKPKLFPWPGERYAYWHFLSPELKETIEVVSTEAALAVGLPLVQTYGYEKVGANPCTKELVLRMLQEESPEAITYRSTVDFTLGARLREELILTFQKKLAATPYNEWAFNVLACLEREWIPLQRLGTLASALCVYSPKNLLKHKEAAASS